MKKKTFTTEVKMIASVKYFEELHSIRDENGEMLFTGSKELAKKVLALLNRDARTRKARRK